MRGNSTIGLLDPYLQPRIRRSPTISARGSAAKVAPLSGRPIITSTPLLSQDRQSLFHCLGVANRDDAGVYSFASQCIHRHREVISRQIDGVCRAEVTCEFELGVEDVDTDDGICAGNRGPLNGVETDPAASEDCNTLSWSDSGCVDHGAESCRHGAPDECCEIKWEFLRNTNGRRFGDHDVRSVSGRAVVIYRFTIKMEASSSARRGACRRRIQAQSGKPESTVFARSAVWCPRDDHMVSRLDTSAAFTDRLDHTRTLVSEDYWHRNAGMGPVISMETAVADAAGGHSQSDFTRAGTIEIDFEHLHGLAWLYEYWRCDLHMRSVLSPLLSKHVGEKLPGVPIVGE